MVKLTEKEQILADVDDEIWFIKKRIQLKYNLTWAKSRDAVNDSIARLCCDCWNEKKMYNCDYKK